MRVKNKLIFLGIAILFILNLSFSFAATLDATNLSIVKARASTCLNESQETMNFLIAEGFNVMKVNDTLKEAISSFDAQTLLQSRKRPYDYNLVVEKCDAILKIHEDALDSRDQLETLLKFYNESITSNMNASSADKIIESINAEIEDERYENVDNLIQQAYSKITEIQSSYTALNIFYSATARGFKAIFLRNWKVVLAVIIILFILFITYRIKIAKYLLTKKMEGLKNRKKTIKELVMKTQEDYFQLGKIPEGTYNIKTKKYAELIRDIDRQIPLLQEELSKFGSKK